VRVVEAKALSSWASALLRSWGYSEPEAEFIAESLVDANLRGVDSHGVLRLPAYAARVEHGLVLPAAQPVVTTRGGVVSVDANAAAGQIAARDAMEALAEAAARNGVGTAVIRGSAHFGAAGYYARLLAERGFIAFVVSNSEPVVVPHGGRQALLGTNPFAVAVPTAAQPISLDMATSTVAMGKIMVAAARHEEIPADWGVDAHGEPTTVPGEVTALLPMGGPKGYGLGMIVEILGGVLSGAAIAHELGNMYDDLDRPQNVGHWMLAIDVEAIMPRAVFDERIESLAAMVRATQPLDEARPVLMPGEPEERTSAVRAVDGIPLPDDTIAELTELSERYQVPIFEVSS
jgi:ureidoglycolate dehydrogenase (NAD+)